MKNLVALALLACGVVAANAQVLTLTDGNTFNADSSVNVNNDSTAAEYSASYANGSGSGFGGTLGGATIRMEATANNMYFGFNPNGGIFNNIVVLIDSKAGGFTDATMNDTSDGGRAAVTRPIANGLLTGPSGFAADYAIVFGSFGSVSFELTGGSLNFLTFKDTAGSVANNRELSISRSTMGLTSANFGFNWVAYMTSDTGYMSDEVMPGPAIAGGNPGFDNSVTISNFNRFEAVPEPASMTALALGVAALARRRRKA